MTEILPWEPNTLASPMVQSLISFYINEKHYDRKIISRDSIPSFYSIVFILSKRTKYYE